MTLQPFDKRKSMAQAASIIGVDAAHQPASHRANVATEKVVKNYDWDAQHEDESPSVIVYETQTVIASGQATTASLSPALTCHPAA